MTLRRTIALHASARRRGLSLTELLIAMAISLIFMGSVVTAYVQISRAADVAESEVQAQAKARAAVDTIARDLLQVRTDPFAANQTFLLEDTVLTYGDNIDNDGDGSVDEEPFDGRDNDGDWTAARDDNHAVVSPAFTERPDFVGIADYGDFDVDEDVLFSRDRLTIRIPGNPGAGQTAQLISYFIGSYQGYDNVLLREVTENPDFGPTTTVEPVIFDAVSLDFLAWNLNESTIDPAAWEAPGGLRRPYWRTEYDANDFFFPDFAPYGATQFGTPPFTFPAAVMVRVTVNAESFPLDEITDWPLGNGQLKTATATTTSTVFEVLKNPIYRDVIRP